MTRPVPGHAPSIAKLRGVSLIEALLALAVMAFGILGVIGLQVTLRNNADITRQRAEAVRLAQEELENWRSFTTLTTPPPTGHTISFADLTSAPATTLTPSGAANTTYTMRRTVTDNTDGRYKTLRVQVDWTDRHGDTQNIALTSVLMGIAPELSGAVAVPSRSLSNTQNYGRHGSIPKTAVTQSDGTATFAPPAPHPAWCGCSTARPVRSPASATLGPPPAPRPMPRCCLATSGSRWATWRPRARTQSSPHRLLRSPRRLRWWST